MAKQTVSIRVSDELLAMVEAICERTGENRSECMERLVSVGADTVQGTIAELDSPLLGRVWGMLAESPTLLRMVAPELKADEFEAMRKRLVSLRGTRGQKGQKGGGK